MRSLAITAAATLPLALFTGAAAQTSAGQKANKVISTTGTYSYVGLGILLPLIQDGDDGVSHFFRAGDSTAVAIGLSYGIGQLTHERSPNGLHNDSFPSTHAAAAFAVATMQSQYHPWEAPIWYVGASVIGLSRVQLREHTWGQVFGGAALGYGTARLELSLTHGLLIAPFFNANGDPGIALTAKF